MPFSVSFVRATSLALVGAEKGGGPFITRGSGAPAAFLEPFL